MALHKDLTGADLHEPKGIEIAAVDFVYRATGSGSGAWRGIVTQGWEDIADSATAGTPIPLTLANTPYYMTNNGLGVNTNTTYRLPGNTAVWNTSLNQFTWGGSGLAIGDTVDLRLDLSFVTSAANREITVDMDMAIGSGSPYTLNIYKEVFKNAATHRKTIYTSIYLGNTATLNNPAKIAVKSDGTGETVIVNGWFVRAVPRRPRFIT